MENELQTNLDEILLDKETNLLPENLKEGVTVLGVEGSLKVTGSDSNIKLFETVEDMNSDPNPKEADLAVVYRKEIQPFKEDTETQFITFPEQVILDEPFTGNVNSMITFVDPSVMFDGQVRLSQSMFDFNGYSETGMIQVRYQSEDGITYTRQEFMGDSGDLTNPVDLGTIVKWEPMEPFNDVVGKFMLVGSNYFEGLYVYNNNPDINYFKDNTGTIWKMPLDITNKTFKSKDNKNVPIITDKYRPPTNSYTGGGLIVIDDYTSFNKFNQINKCRIFYADEYSYIYHVKDKSTGKTYASIMLYESGSTIENYEDSFGCTVLTIDNKQIVTNYYNNSEMKSIYTEQVGYESFTNVHTGQPQIETSRLIADESLNKCFLTAKCASTSIKDAEVDTFGGELTTSSTSGKDGDITINEKVFQYRIASSQLNISEPNQILKDISAYGSNGVITGDGSITNATNSFDDIPAMLYSEIQAKYDNMEPVVLTNENHIIENIISNSIYTIPVRSDGTPLLDVSNVTNCVNMFRSCKNLKSIPDLNFNNNIQRTDFMFAYCNNLDSMPNITLNSVKNARNMFSGCGNLININGINLSSCNDATYMFADCINLSDINITNVSNINNAYQMFKHTNISYVNNLNLSNTNNVGLMFTNCCNLQSVNNVDVNTAYISGMFSNCSNLKHVDNFVFNTNNISTTFMGAGFESTSDLNIDWSKITSAYSLFYGCKNLYDIYNFSMNNVVNVDSLFINCINIKELPSNYLKDNFPNAINAGYTFKGCTNLYLENNSFYSDELCGCAGLFENCANIKHIDNLYIPLCNFTSNMFSGCTNLSNINNVTFSNSTNCYGMFDNCKSLTEIPNLPYNQITNAVYMFENCMNITTIDKEMNLSNCNCVNYMFHNSGLENVDMSKIKFKSTLNSVTSLFKNCANLTTVTNIDFSGTNINNYINLFNGCTLLSDNIQMQESNNMYNCYAMFMNCTNFKNIPNINYNNIQYCADWMFYDCTNITTINNLNLSKINSFDYGFANCTNLTTVSNINLYNVNRAHSMFKNCTNLTTINNIIFNKINTSLYSAFQGCTNLVNAPNMKINNCINIRNIFLNCVNLVNIPIYNTSKINICSNFVNNCPNLSNDSLNNVLQMCSVMNCTYNLKYVGLTEDQANICMNLSNYQNFINAGWTTGY